MLTLNMNNFILLTVFIIFLVLYISPHDGIAASQSSSLDKRFTITTIADGLQHPWGMTCLLYTSDAADEVSPV